MDYISYFIKRVHILIIFPFTSVLSLLLRKSIGLILKKESLLVSLSISLFLIALRLFDDNKDFEKDKINKAHRIDNRGFFKVAAHISLYINTFINILFLNDLDNRYIALYILSLIGVILISKDFYLKDFKHIPQLNRLVIFLFGSFVSFDLFSNGNAVKIGMLYVLLLILYMLLYVYDNIKAKKKNEYTKNIEVKDDIHL